MLLRQKRTVPNLSYNTIVIIGPTAVGKSSVAIEVASALGGEIISADSMQVYRGLDIGTAKPDAAERARVPHHMIDVADPKEGYSVAEYQKRASLIVGDIISRGKTPVICGGTGLYIHSLLFDMELETERGGGDMRAAYEKLAAERGAEYMHALLAERSPKAAGLIHPNNVKRVIRALERVNGDSAARSVKGAKAEAATSGGYRRFSFNLPKNNQIDAALFLLTRDREDLRRRIDERVDAMLRAGLLDEVRGLARAGLGAGQISMLGIGYKEALGCLNGEYGEAEMAELIKIHTRRYAKRQMTWMGRYEDARVIDLTSTGIGEAADMILCRS
jgi:tRNA dimethylallyltransferase